MTEYGSGDTAHGMIIPGNRVRIDFTGKIIKLTFEEMKGLGVGDKVTIHFLSYDRVDYIEGDNFGGVF